MRYFSKSILYFCCFEKLDYTSRYPIIVNVYHEFNLFQNKNFHFALSPIGFKTQFSISSLSTSKRSKHKSTMSVSASKRPTHRRIAILLRCIVATLHKALSMLLIRYRSSGWSWKISNQFQEFQATWCNDSHQLSNFNVKYAYVNLIANINSLLINENIIIYILDIICLIWKSNKCTSFWFLKKMKKN